MWLWLNHSMVILTWLTQSNDSSEHWMLTMIETILTGNRIPNIWNRQWGQERSLSLFSIIAAVCCVVKNLHLGNGIQSPRDGHRTMEISRCRFLHKRTYNPPDLYNTAQVSSQISFYPLSTRAFVECPPVPPVRGVMEECWSVEDLGPGLSPGLHQRGAAVRGLQALGGPWSRQEKGSSKGLVSSLYHQHHQLGYSALDR